MMKRMNNLLLGIIGMLVLSACSNSETYAELVSDEREAIDNYIDKEGIEVLSTFPADSIFGEKQYYKDSQGLYIHIDTLGGSRKVRKGEEVLIWFTKNGPLPATTVSSTNLTSPKPDEFVYQENYTSSRYAWVAPLTYVGSHGKVKLIAPHSTGNSDDQSNVAAYIYEVEYILTGFDE